MFESCGGCCLSLALIPLLCICLAACGVIYVTTATMPEPPVDQAYQPIPIEATNFEQKVTNMQNLAQGGGRFLLEFSQRELSSWLNLKALSLIGVVDNALTLENAQAKIDDNTITFYAEFTDLGVEIPLELVIQPKIDLNNHLALDITEANVAGVGMPDIVLQQIINTFEDALTKPLNDLRLGYSITELQVDNGQFRLRGQAGF